MIPVGHGLPGWLDTRVYFSADETRRLFRDRLGVEGLCTLNPNHTGRIEGAHIVRKMMGGRKGGEGPMVLLCETCHDYLDDRRHVSLAVQRGTLEVCYLTLVYDSQGTIYDRGKLHTIQERPLGVYARPIEG
jgi:hypothetical protein